MKRLDLTAGVVDGLSMKEDLDLIWVLLKSSWDELTMRGQRARSARGHGRVGGTTRWPEAESHALKSHFLGRLVTEWIYSEVEKLFASHSTFECDVILCGGDRSQLRQTSSRTLPNGLG